MNLVNYHCIYENAPPEAMIHATLEIYGPKKDLEKFINHMYCSKKHTVHVLTPRKVREEGLTGAIYHFLQTSYDLSAQEANRATELLLQDCSLIKSLHGTADAIIKKIKLEEENVD